MPAQRNDLARKLAEAALHAVADDSAANLLGDGEANSFDGIPVVPVADEQNEARGCRAPSGVRSEEIRALP